MELVQVEILCTTITARYGTLNGGDLLRTDAEYAKHLVDDCGAAKYAKAAAEGEAESEADGNDGDKLPAANADTAAEKSADPAVKATRKK